MSKIKPKCDLSYECRQSARVCKTSHIIKELKVAFKFIEFTLTQLRTTAKYKICDVLQGKPKFSGERLIHLRPIPGILYTDPHITI